MNSMFDGSVNNLITLDGVMDEAAQDKQISQLFTIGRHDNLSVILDKICISRTREKSSDWILITRSFSRIPKIKHSLQI